MFRCLAEEVKVEAEAKVDVEVEAKMSPMGPWSMSARQMGHLSAFLPASRKEAKQVASKQCPQRRSTTGLLSEPRHGASGEDGGGVAGGGSTCHYNCAVIP